MSKRPKKKKQRQRAEGFEIVGLGGGFLIAYLIARFTLTSHPLHWLAAAAGGAIGYIIVFTWARVGRVRS